MIVIAGVAAILAVETRELPDVDRPIVSVRAEYPGASPETMDTEVISILEGAVARVSGIKNIRSASEENNGRMYVEFRPGVDLDAADAATGFTGWLAARGFAKERPFTRMYRGRSRPFGDPGLTVAIAGPELG
mgnify:CR=1 FL=1